ncbi:F-box/WD repeat-containing protein 2 isoform X2 [Lingula anatina]|uniref:F-box/WD repeat-containing protein 2 isoform X1 n=1 Tax=Lingula anatina TaxID=7574 RepID=A0A1S3H033_LINAN|nr:F-box/WD repeat-containing protein 2 isoform X1 [Lingula anatina]XP_013379486.1 F-box/WD repeat-containing protein 2 isoform X1 [Lingula anatina]XP_013379487.1 F-box/WD repeat-containing protein 2 isoform X2 [Lingula anatina]|eukprot:XP_013379485.1 F-box/WD repeat-containing protein 2 isoform X1 [Lingula anatina]
MDNTMKTKTGTIANFDSWLEKAGQSYSLLSDEERNKVLDHLITISTPSQLYHLSQKLDDLVKRDFLQLPTEVSFHLISFLDPASLLTCCMVNKQWNRVINSCGDVWRRACQSIGVKCTKEDQSGQYYKELFLTVSARLQKMKNGSAFESRVLYGHTDRIMAIFYREGKLATGSDDHTVRLWDCKDGQCLKVFDTHTVADLKFDDHYLVTGSFDSTAACWEVDTGKKLRQYQGHVAAVFTIDFNTDLNILVTGSADNTVKLWSFDTANLLQTFTSYSDWVTKVVIVKNTEMPSLYHIISASSSDGPTVTLATLDRDHETQGGLTWRFRHYVPHFQIKNDILYFPTVTSKGAIMKLEQLDHTTEVSNTSYQKFWDSSDVHVILGIGSKYFAFICGEPPVLKVIETPEIRANGKSMDSARGVVISSKNIPNVRLSKRGSTFTLGEMGWLDGMSDANQKGVIFAASLQDNGVYILKWKRRKKQRRAVHFDL